MFEAAELGQKISKEEFTAALTDLKIRLIKAQARFRAYGGPLIIILNGIDGAGKGEFVNFIGSMLDMRNVSVKTFWQETEDEKERPHFWRYWMSLPERGHIGFFFGAWYADEIAKFSKDKISEMELDNKMRDNAGFEEMLADDGAVFIKLWFHLDKKTAKKRADDFRSKHGKNKFIDTPKWNEEHYNKQITAAERSIRLTDSVKSSWYLIDAEHKKHRMLKSLRIITETLEKYAGSIGAKPHRSKVPVSSAAPLLSSIDLSLSVEHAEYTERLLELQKKLYKLCWEAFNKKRSVIAAFEGWDAAGKGSAIRRVLQGTDMRLVSAISAAAPSDEEKAHNYLWRFWRHIPRAGFMTLYDRSWYGRVLVERVEKFATPAEWGRAYKEINDFEEHLTKGGIILTKFWIHIDKDEQLKRFKERESVEWKQYKITEEDWRNREKWDIYEKCANEMIARTSTSNSTWNIIAGNDKKYARLKILEILCTVMEERL